ncbi:MAG: hypothetical protein HYW07_10485 [Candidatus Latescibacteria bacterium]|nr:hypothetical protein [Candidatus Latescibacterota bacterium]
MPTLFPLDLPAREWRSFAASGFSAPACGILYRSADQVFNGMPLGNIDTGCLDQEASGLLGYCSLFNTFAPRRGPLNTPLLGVSAEGRTWVLAQDQPKEGVGEYQYQPGGTYRRWSGEGWASFAEPLKPGVSRLNLEGVRMVSQIHYWGHYPVADVEFELDGPLQVGLRAWTAFLPGDLRASLMPGMVFEVHLHNTARYPLPLTLACSFPGPDPQEAGSARFARRQVKGEGFEGVEVNAPLVSYTLGALGGVPLRLGGELGAEGQHWARIARSLPASGPQVPGASAAVDCTVEPGEEQVVRLVLCWCAPTWNAGGYNWAGAAHTYTHMYASHYPDPVATARLLAREHQALLRRVLAWQQVVYGEERLPLWLRDSLVNILHLLAEDSLWAQKGPALPAWVREEDGLFGMNECPRGCPQTECLPNTFYGNQPLVYFFPELALSTLRGYKGYQFADGAPTWSFGGCTTNTPPASFSTPARGYQFATNGISLVAMIDRFLLCHATPELLAEFYPVVERCTRWTLGLCAEPAYTEGERIIAMPDPQRENPPREWFEADYPGWFGLAAHTGDLHLAQLALTARLAAAAGDEAFARQCRSWLEAGANAMEKRLWQGTHYLNCFDPKTGRQSDLVFSFQLDGECILRHHGLPLALSAGRVQTTLETIRRCCVPLSRCGVVNYAKPDGSPRDPARAGTWDYGAYGSFPAQVNMLALLCIYEGKKELGLELAHRTWHNLICLQGCAWEQPNRTRGEADTGEPDRAKGWTDYFQSMNLWSLPAALAHQDFAGPTRPGGLVHRIIAAAQG